MVALIPVLLVVGCATTEPAKEAAKDVRKLAIAQVGMTSTEFVTCRDCPQPTRKTIALPPAPVAAVANAQVLAVAHPTPAIDPAKTYKVHFKFGKATLDAVGRAELAAAANELKGKKGAIAVLGRTDPIGAFKFNTHLAMKRARAVRAGLVASSVTAAAITAGKHNPCCDGNKQASAEVHRDLRRADVEIILTTTK